MNMIGKLINHMNKNLLSYKNNACLGCGQILASRTAINALGSDIIIVKECSSYFPRDFEERLRAFALAYFAKSNGAKVKLSFDCPLLESDDVKPDMYLIRPKSFEFKTDKDFILDIPSMPLWNGENPLAHLAYH